HLRSLWWWRRRQCMKRTVPSRRASPSCTRAGLSRATGASSTRARADLDDVAVGLDVDRAALVGGVTLAADDGGRFALALLRVGAAHAAPYSRATIASHGEARMRLLRRE